MKNKSADKQQERKPGKCAFVDALLLAGQSTLEQIIAATMAQFPAREEKPTISTIRTRRSDLRHAGKTAGWVEAK